MRFSNRQVRDSRDAQPPSPESQGEVALAYLGSIVPDEPQFHNAAFNPSGQMYQRELILGLKHAGLPPSIILSVIPIPAYPKVGRLWVPGGQTFLPEALPVTLLPFLNITPIKQVAIGLAVVLHLLAWRWRTRRAKFRIVYTYNLTVPPGLFTLIGARLISAKAVVSVCDVDVPGQTVPSRWPWRLDYWLQRKLIPRFDGHIVAADAIAREFIPGRPYLRLEGGVRNDLLRNTHDGSAKDNTRGTFVITAAGTLNDTNGIPTLLKAFSLLGGEQYRLRIAGRGPLDQLVKEAAKKDSRIEYLGFISFGEVFQLYKRSSVLINMRMTQNVDTRYFFPGKMMEYLASGTPVITTSTGHTGEEFGQFTYLLRDETARSLATLIQHVAALSPEARERIGQTAQEYMALHKTWEAQSKKAARFIREVVLGIDVAPLGTLECSSGGFVDPQRPLTFLRAGKVTNKCN